MSSNLLTVHGKDALLDLNRLVRKPIKVTEKNLIVKLLFPKKMIVSFYNTIQVPDGYPVDDYLLFHEFQHYLDRCVLDNGEYQTSFIRSTWWYAKYFIPHILSFFSLLSVLAIPFSLLFLFFLTFLIFILPMPRLTTFRRNMEIRGYFWTSMFLRNVNYANIFGGKKYYYMDNMKSNAEYLDIFSHMVGTNAYDDNDNIATLYKIYTEHMLRKYA